MPIFSGGLLNLTLHLSEEQISYVMACAQLCLPMQMVGAYLQQRFFRRKSFWLVTNLIYYTLFSMIVLLIGVWVKLPLELAAGLLLLFYALAQAASNLGASIYMAWLGDLVPARESNSFWIRRQGWILMSGLLSGIAIGYLVDLLGKEQIGTYLIVLMLGILGGVLSVIVQLRIPAADHSGKHISLPLWVVLRELLKNKRFVRLSLFFAVQTFVVMLSCTYQFVYITGNVETGNVGMSMTEAQIMLASANLAGFAGGYIFRVIGNKYGRKPILMICTACKIPEFVLWGFFFHHDSHQILWAMPVFVFGGFLNMGIVVTQLSLLTGVTSSRLRGVAMGIYAVLVGGCGFLGTVVSGQIYPRLDALVIGDLVFQPFNILAFVTAVGLALDLLIMVGFKENGAAPAGKVLRALFMNNPVRSIYQPYLLSQPLNESARSETLLRADGKLSGSEIAHDFYNPSSRVRQSAVLAALRQGENLDGNIEEELIKLLQQPELGFQPLAARALGVARSRKALPVLLNYLDSDDNTLSQACVFALGMIGDKVAAPELIRILSNDRKTVLWPLAAESLSKVSGPENARLIYEAYTNAYNPVLKSQYLLALSRLFLSNPSLAQARFEREEKIPGSEAERILRTLAGNVMFRQHPEGANFCNRSLALLDSCQDSLVLESALLILLNGFGVHQQANESNFDFLCNRFLPGGRLRESVFARQDKVGYGLSLAIRIYSEMNFHPESGSRYLLLTALTALEAVCENLLPEDITSL